MKYALFIFVFCSFQLSAQQAIQWQKCLGGTSYETINSIQPTTDAGYIACGSVFDNGGDVVGAIGGGDFWVVKLDSLGVIKWKKILGGTLNDIPYDIQQAKDGGYIVAGSTESNNVNVSGNHGMTDYWVVKLNKSGWMEWQKTYGGTRTEECNSIRQTDDGGYILAGKSGSKDGDVSENHGFLDYWIVKIDSIGNIEWQKSFGGSNGADIAKCINLTEDGGYIIAGETGSNNGDVSGNHGNGDFWIIKIDSIGNLQWQKPLGGSGLDSGAWVTQTSDGSFVVIGTTGSGNSGNVSGTHGGSDIWVVKLDASGLIQWQKSLGGSDDEQGAWIGELQDGSFILAGSALSNNGDVEGNHGNYDFWLVQLSSSGNLLKQQPFGGSDYETCYNGSLSQSGEVILGGIANSTNGDVEGLHGTYDGWVVKLSPTNTPTLTPPLTQLTLYPNPTNQQITLQTPDNEPITSIQITDLSGKTLKTEQAPQDKTLQVAMLPKGMYLLKATSDSGKVFCGKFIKE